MVSSLLIGLRFDIQSAPNVTLVGRPINSSIQCVAARRLGSDVDADRASDPTPNNIQLNQSALQRDQERLGTSPERG